MEILKYRVKLIYVIISLIAVFMISMKPESQEFYPRFEDVIPSATVVYDECEYVINKKGTCFVHKANCRYCEERELNKKRKV